MNLNKLIIFLFCVISFESLARNEIREVYTNDRTIKPIYLALGRSTVLKFREKPTNVVVGNKNYYNIEYINNDLTVQPLGAVDTNLFIYTESKRTYALILKIVPATGYDDIVHVRWKSKYSSKKSKGKTRKRSLLKIKPISLILKKALRTDLITFKSLPQKDSYYLDFLITNKSKKVFKTSEVDIYLTRRNQKLKIQQLFFRKEKINQGEVVQARIFITLEKKSGFSVNVKFKGKTKKTIIGRKYL